MIEYNAVQDQPMLHWFLNGCEGKSTRLGEQRHCQFGSGKGKAKDGQLEIAVLNNVFLFSVSMDT